MSPTPLAPMALTWGVLPLCSELWGEGEGGSVSQVPRKGKRTPSLRQTSGSPRNRPELSPVLDRLQPGTFRVESEASPSGIWRATRCGRFEGGCTRTLQIHESKRNGQRMYEGSSAVCSGKRLWDPNSGIPPSKVRNMKVTIRQVAVRSAHPLQEIPSNKESNKDARRPR